MQNQNFEARIGEAVAHAAFACAKGLGEYNAGVTQPDTRLGDRSYGPSALAMARSS
jgi:hypothetical protein